MRFGKAYLIGWLTLQWLAMGPVAAGLSFFMLFTDGHGLPASGWPISVAIFGVATIGYAIALRVVLRTQESS